MSVLKAGTKVDFFVSYMEMHARPEYPRPAIVGSSQTALIRAERPPAWFFLDLYDAVGGEYEWNDRHEQPRDELQNWLKDDKVNLFSFLRLGWPHGFFVLDTREAGVCELAYFGLVPDAMGKGLGRYLLHTAVHTGWDQAGVKRMTLNTCTLDHPRAYELYSEAGFTLERREKKSMTLTRDRKFALGQVEDEK